MSIAKDCRKFLTLFRGQGLAQAILTARAALMLRFELGIDRWFDQKFHIDTCSKPAPSDLTIDSHNVEHGAEYDPTPFRMIRCILRRIPQADDFVFVDFGSGKGRVLFVAAEFQFKKIVGVEFAKELHEAALRNHRNYRNRNQKCFDIVVLHADAAEFAIPEDKCILFFYAPFRPPVMSRIVENVWASYNPNPRKIYVVYVSPFHKDVFESCGIFQEVPAKRRWFSAILPDRLDVVMYETPT